MSEDPIRKYSDAMGEFNSAYSGVRKLGEITADVSRYLNNKPYKLMVSNVGVGFPAEIAMGGAEYTLNANNWPSAKEIAEALASLHEKRKRVKEIWTSLSPNDKQLVSPPDTHE